jgi:hypothetical protein
MARGTTTSTGLVHSYFVNIFGPAQYRELHESLAVKTFDAALRSGVWIGELRTRLAIPGYQAKGPEEAANALLSITANGLQDVPEHSCLTPVSAPQGRTG